MFSILHLLDCQGNRIFYFIFFLPSLFSIFSLLIHPLLPPPPSILFLSLPHSHSTHHPPTYRCSLSFVSFSPCENYPPYYHFIVLYYYLLLLPSSFLHKKILKNHIQKQRELAYRQGPFQFSLFTRARYSPSLGRATLLLQSAQLSSSEHLLKKTPLKEAGSSVHLIFFILHIYYYCRQVLR